MKRIVYILIVLFISLLGTSLGWWLRGVYDNPNNEFFLSTSDKELQLVKYEIPIMKDSNFDAGEFRIVEILSKENLYTSYLFELDHYPNFESQNLKVTTGQINIPNIQNIKDEGLQNRLIGNSFPIVLMLRGFVSQEIYETGIGSRSGAAYFARNGFITIAPDFLGYASSDGNSEDIFESRFQTYTTAISTMKKIENFEVSISPSISVTPELTLITQGNVITSPIFIWAHSNGGQIALTLLEVTEGTYPTTLWAPVTKGFPYSVLYYTDESTDKGKYIRRELAQFEQLYDVDRFSIDNYFEYIQAPIQIHQGGNDDAIPLEWSNKFVAKLRSLDKDVIYYTYPAADHNMNPNWNEVIKRDLEFYNNYLNTQLDTPNHDQP